jgi:hypothetical protein
MPKKKHFFFHLVGKGGCPPAFATGAGGDVTLTSAGAPAYYVLSALAYGGQVDPNIFQFDNLDIQAGATLIIDVGSGTSLVQIICKSSCNIAGEISVRNVWGYPSFAKRGWENNGSSVSGTTISAYTYSASISQVAGGAGGTNGGAGTNGYGGGGGGGNSGAQGGANNAPGNSSSAAGGAGGSTGGGGNVGGNVTPGSSVSGAGGAGGGSGGGGGRTTSTTTPGNPGDPKTGPTPPTTSYNPGPGGGGGGNKGRHGGYLFLYFCETITGSGQVDAGGGYAYIGGSEGTGGAGGASGGGGGAGGSGGHFWLECAAHSLTTSVGGGAGDSGAGGGSSGGSGNSGSFTYIPV